MTSPPATRRLWAFVSMAFLAQTACAHKLLLFAYADQDAIKIEAYFAGGAPAADIDLWIYQPHDTLILRRRTGASGTARFQPKTGDAMRIVARTLDGHGTTYRIHRDEVALALQHGNAMPPDGRIAAQSIYAAPAPRETDNSMARPSAAMQQDYDKLLRENALLKKQLIREKRPEMRERIRDIVSGLGWIMGIVGIALYRMRKTSKPVKNIHPS